jgi:hypothetical protein
MIRARERIPTALFCMGTPVSFDGQVRGRGHYREIRQFFGVENEVRTAIGSIRQAWTSNATTRLYRTVTEEFEGGVGSLSVPPRQKAGPANSLAFDLVILPV